MDYTKIGENIDLIRKQRGLTKSALAERMECTRPVVLRHLKEGKMSLEYLTRYAEVLGCSVGDLTDGVTDPEGFHLTADILSYYPYNLIAAVLFRDYEKEATEKLEEIRRAVYRVYVPAFEDTLHELKEREREILRMRYENGMTLEQCGKKYNVTSNRIRQLENKALRRMRRPGSEGSWTFETVSSMADVTKEISSLQAENKAIRSQLARLSERVSQYEKKEAEEEAARREKEVPIEKLELSVRSYNSLKRANIETLKDLSGKTMSELMGIRNLGNKSLEEVLKKMADYGVSPKEEEEEEK